MKPNIHVVRSYQCLEGCLCASIHSSPSLSLSLTHTQTNLKDYDQDILKELRKIRLAVHDIQDTQKEVKKEQKYLDLSYNTDLSPTRSSPLELVPPSLSPSPTPSPEPFVASDGHRYRTGTLELLTTAPTHLKQKDDEKLLEEFFGPDQINRLNDFKVTIAEEEGESAEMPSGKEVKLRTGKGQKLKIPINPNSGPIDRNRMSYDVASEMEQLRARIQQKARMELEDLDKKYSPKFSHPGFGLLDSSSHSRQGSLDSSIPNSTNVSSSDLPVAGQTRHSRQASLPVFFDPASILSLAKKSPTPQLKTQAENQFMEDNSRSPTPPLNYIHVRQASAGSSGSGTISPPLTLTSGHGTSSQQNHVTGYKSTPSQRNAPQIQSLRERPIRPQSGKIPPQNQDLSINHTHSHSQPAHLPSQFTVANSRGGYSTAIVKGPRRHSPEGSKPNGYITSKPPLPANHSLLMSRGGAGDLDQPELKSISRVTQLRRAPSGDKVAASPRMARNVPPPTTSHVPGPNNTHQKLGMRLSEPGNMANFQAKQNGAQVHPVDIEPYMTSNELRGQMFKYTPYTDNVTNEKTKSLDSSSASQSRKASLLPNEQTWC